MEEDLSFVRQANVAMALPDEQPGDTAADGNATEIARAGDPARPRCGLTDDVVEIRAAHMYKSDYEGKQPLTLDAL